MSYFLSKYEEVAIGNVRATTFRHRVQLLLGSQVTRTYHEVSERTIGQPRIRKVPLKKVSPDRLHVLRVGTVQEKHANAPDRRRDNEHSLDEVQITTGVNSGTCPYGLRDLTNTYDLASLALPEAAPRESDTRAFRSVRMFQGTRQNPILLLRGMTYNALRIILGNPDRTTNGPREANVSRQSGDGTGRRRNGRRRASPEDI